MTDLTEQFNNDEIDESKLYYFKQKMSEEIEVGRPFALNMVRAMDEIYLDWFLIDKVLAPVPSYEEWQAELEENIKLRELLKECRYKIIADLDDARLCESSVDIEDFEYLLDRINQALGEDK